MKKFFEISIDLILVLILIYSSFSIYTKFLSYKKASETHNKVKSAYQK
ncbi:hypothetical protein [Paraclostridium sordellii]|nr:hypothetical protein [Paeniclostridium sordellii]